MAALRLAMPPTANTCHLADDNSRIVTVRVCLVLWETSRGLTPIGGSRRRRVRPWHWWSGGCGGTPARRRRGGGPTPGRRAVARYCRPRPRWSVRGRSGRSLHRENDRTTEFSQATTAIPAAIACKLPAVKELLGAASTKMSALRMGRGDVTQRMGERHPRRQRLLEHKAPQHRLRSCPCQAGRAAPADSARAISATRRSVDPPRSCVERRRCKGWSERVAAGRSRRPRSAPGPRGARGLRPRAVSASAFPTVQAAGSRPRGNAAPARQSRLLSASQSARDRNLQNQV